MNYTTIEQSKRLLNLGLNPETADMCIWESEGKLYVYVCKPDDINCIPCWSLGALWDINNICGIGPNNFGNKDVSSEHLFNTLYRWICIELIEDSDGLNSILIEEGYIKKGTKDE